MLPGDSPVATCSYGEGFLSQTLGKQLPPEPLSACPAFIRRKSIREKQTFLVLVHTHPWAAAALACCAWQTESSQMVPEARAGGHGLKLCFRKPRRNTTFVKGFSLFPSPAQGHIPGSKFSRVRHETQTSWASPPKGTSFQQAAEVGKLSYESPRCPRLHRRPIPSHSHMHFPEAGGEEEGRQDPPSRQALAEPEPRINMLRL